MRAKVQASMRRTTAARTLNVPGGPLLLAKSRCDCGVKHERVCIYLPDRGICVPSSSKMPRSSQLADRQISASCGNSAAVLCSLAFQSPLVHLNRQSRFRCAAFSSGRHAATTPAIQEVPTAPAHGSMRPSVNSLSIARWHSHRGAVPQADVPSLAKRKTRLSAGLCVAASVSE